MTERPRRARPAAAARVLAGGLSASATLGIVGALAAGAPPQEPVVVPVAEGAPDPAPPPVVRVVVRVHHPAPVASARPAAVRAPAYVVPPPRPAVRKVYVRRGRPAPQPVTTSHGSR